MGLAVCHWLVFCVFDCMFICVCLCAIVCTFHLHLFRFIISQNNSHTALAESRRQVRSSCHSSFTIRVREIERKNVREKERECVTNAQRNYVVVCILCDDDVACVCVLVCVCVCMCVCVCVFVCVAGVVVDGAVGDDARHGRRGCSGGRRRHRRRRRRHTRRCRRTTRTASVRSGGKR